MEKYKLQIIQELQELKARKRKAVDLQEILFLSFEIGVKEEQIKLIEKEGN